MRFLVTGGAGFIGSHLSERLLQDGHEVINLDNFNDYYDPGIKFSNIRNIQDHPNYRLVKGEILDPVLIERLFSENRFDAVVHLAARAGVRPSIQQPILYQQVNIEGTMRLLDAAVRHHIPKFIMASSSSVYGNNTKVPFSENDPVDHPVSPYAATKKACELLAYTYHTLYGIAITALRFFTVYGPRQRPDMAIHQFTRQIHAGKSITLFGDGTSRRDYTYITDIIDGLVAAIENCRAYHIYNLGESATIELKNLIDLIESNLGQKAKIRWMPEQPGDVRITFADISRAKTELGYQPRVQIEKGIPLFTSWYSKQFDSKD